LAAKEFVRVKFFNKKTKKVAFSSSCLMLVVWSTTEGLYFGQALHVLIYLEKCAGEHCTRLGLISPTFYKMLLLTKIQIALKDSQAISVFLHF